jgi:acyl-CoA dehydrogenase
VASEQRLIASVTSEVGTGGDLGRSVAAVQREGERFSLTKEATTVSYGQVADDLLISVRRSEDAAPNDQVAVLALKGEYELTERGGWDALGMRGTCSPAATTFARGAVGQILPEPFNQIAAHTMVPVSHVLWASVWLGIAQDAVSIAREQLREQGRKGTESCHAAPLELAELVRRLQLMQGEVESMASFVGGLRAAGDRQATSSLGFALRINGLKLTASRMVVELVTDAMRVCGIAGYKNDSRFSLGRQLRDAHSAPLMINNARIADHNAQLALLFKGENT